MSQRWHKVILIIATWAGGAAVALSGVGFAAALFPAKSILYEEEVKSADSPRAAPASEPSTLPASAPVELAPAAPVLGESLGEFKITFYVLTEETKHQDEAYDTPLYKKDGTLIGKFPKRFVSDLRIQGSARLASGNILAHGGRCEYGPGVCYRILSRKKYPWGQGSTGRPLKLLQSAAIDPRVIPYGVKIYVPELDGVVVRGKTFNGCFSTDDTGGGIRGKEIDLFAGSRKIISQIKKRIPTLRATVYRGGPHCGEEPAEKDEKITKSEKIAGKTSGPSTLAP